MDGTPRELFRSPSAELFLIVDNERLLMKSGDFALLLVKSSISPLAAVTAMVGEVQWPVGSDCAVHKEGDASFVFVLPGPLQYLLFLNAETMSSADLRRVEDLLEEYAAYIAAPQLEFQQAGDASGTQRGDNSMKLLCMSVGSEVSAEPEVSSMGIGVSLSCKRPGGADTRGRVQRARRLSAVTKLFSKTLERGAINVTTHVEPMVMEAPADQCPTSASSLALAGANAVIRVVDAVETGGRTLLESVGSVITKKYSQSSSSETGASMVEKPSLLNSGWTLNKLGLLMLFRMIGASMAAQSSGSSGSISRRSRSSSSSDICRLLSSSSSSSSLSSKLPTTASQLPPGLATESPGLQRSTTVAGTTAPPPPPPPPPLFSSATLRVRHPSTMPPPSGPPAPAGSSSQDSSSSFRIYKPQASSATTSPLAPSPSPPLPRRPPRFQPPPRS